MNPFRCHQCGATMTSMNNVWDFSVSPSTRHNRLLNSNEVPSDAEIPVVQFALENADARLASLEAEMTRLRGRLRQLEEEHVALSIYRTQNKAILSPLRRMPPEVLSEIFCWTLPTARDEVLHPRFGTAHCPWALTHISGLWRTISVANPSLWSLLVVVYTRDRDSSLYPLSMVETQIARAQTLKIHFYGCEDTDPVPQIELFQCLAKHASRWEELSLELTSALFPLLASLRGHVPSLRRLWIQWDCEESQMAADSIDFCQSASSLVDAGVLSQYRFIPFSLPAHQLTRYDLDAPWETHRHVLKLAPNFVEARICVVFDHDEPWPDPHEFIDLPSLRTLLVSHSEILQFLRFPLLEKITMQLSEEDGPEVVNHLKYALIRSFCPLRSLCIHGHADHSMTVTILRECCSPDELIVLVNTPAASTEANMLMQKLTISDVNEGTIVAPQLSHIFLGFVNKSCVERGGFLDMAKSRWKTETCAFQRATLLIDSTTADPYYDDTATAGDLDSLRDEGLDLVLLTGTATSDVMDKWLCRARWT
ncbi:hypothetical protein DFH06DRAFT_1477175 [Mycena polygramma]|nr:hypothetical protein DFH06DRAFT_1477175 [Mycena polygramma]